MTNRPHIMKFKFLSILLAVTIVFTLSSFDEKNKSCCKNNDDNKKCEKVDDCCKASKEFSGDPAKDAKMAALEIIGLMKKDFKSLDEIMTLETEMEAIQKKYEDFYKAKGDAELQKFNDELNKLEDDPEIKKQLEEAQQIMMKNAQKFMK